MDRLEMPYLVEREWYLAWSLETVEENDDAVGIAGDIW